MPKLQFQGKKGVQSLQEAEDHAGSDWQAVASCQGRQPKLTKTAQRQENEESDGADGRDEQGGG